MYSDTIFIIRCGPLSNENPSHVIIQKYGVTSSFFVPIIYAVGTCSHRLTKSAVAKQQTYISGFSSLFEIFDFGNSRGSYDIHRLWAEHPIGGNVYFLHYYTSAYCKISSGTLYHIFITYATENRLMICTTNSKAPERFGSGYVIH